MTYSLYINDIKKAQRESKPWNSPSVNSFKQWIKKLKIKNQNDRCCYCFRDISREPLRSLHIEHVLPKSLFSPYMFDFYNLSISCPRCNSDIKKDRVDFIPEYFISYSLKWSYHVYKSNEYKIIHPNLDKINEHLDFKCFVLDNRIYHSYSYKTMKGEYHYNFFELWFYTKEKINEYQGVVNNSEVRDERELINELFNKKS